LRLSRRNERRAEERRNDKNRDCKFESHQNFSVIAGHLKPQAGEFVPAHLATSRKVNCSNELVRDCSAINPSLFQTSVTFQT
jgi:hypothetical protein